MSSSVSTRRWSILIVALAGALALAACGDDGNNNPPIDARVADAADIDAVDVDASMPDAADPDAATPDAASPDANDTDAGSADASTGPMTSMQIATARGTADGTGLDLPITFATVTYLKPAIGSITNDPVGFTIQAEQAGPALYIAVDPAGTTPVLAVGDVVSFSITDLTTINGLRAATAITGLTRSATGANVNALVQDLTAVTDVVTALDSYESELVDVTGTVAGAFTGSGTGFEQATIATTGIAADANYRVRIPTTLRSSIDLVTGCQFVLDNVPVYRFNAVAEVPAYVAADISISGCPAPTVASAVAASATTVVVTFSRNVAPGSVVADGSQFTFDNGLTASAASVSGRTVTLTTSAQTGGAAYTVTVAGAITDLQGTALGSPNSATFNGFQVLAVVRINEVNANIASGCDLIELRVVSGGVMTGYRLMERDTTTLLTFPAFSVATNDLIVVHNGSGSATCNPGGASAETTGPAQQPRATFGANFDTAYDFYSTDTGLTNTDNVFTLYNSLDAIIDAVFVSDDPAGPSAATGTENQAALVGAANQWSPMLTEYIDTVFRTNAADDLNATGTAAAGTSIQRIDNTDDNDKADWSTGAGPASTWGALNAGETAF